MKICGLTGSIFVNYSAWRECQLTCLSRDDSFPSHCRSDSVKAGLVSRGTVVGGRTARTGTAFADVASPSDCGLLMLTDDRFVYWNYFSQDSVCRTFTQDEFEGMLSPTFDDCDGAVRSGLVSDNPCVVQVSEAYGGHRSLSAVDSVGLSDHLEGSWLPVDQEIGADGEQAADQWAVDEKKAAAADESTTDESTTGDEDSSSGTEGSQTAYSDPTTDYTTEDTTNAPATFTTYEETSTATEGSGSTHDNTGTE
ncbi:hypothetical protein GNI_070020, partial [Gregarina niphandrodes]